MALRFWNSFSAKSQAAQLILPMRKRWTPSLKTLSSSLITSKMCKQHENCVHCNSAATVWQSPEVKITHFTAYFSKSISQAFIINHHEHKRPSNQNNSKAYAFKTGNYSFTSYFVWMLCAFLLLWSSYWMYPLMSSFAASWAHSIAEITIESKPELWKQWIFADIRGSLRSLFKRHYLLKIRKRSRS